MSDPIGARLTDGFLFLGPVVAAACLWLWWWVVAEVLALVAGLVRLDLQGILQEFSMSGRDLHSNRQRSFKLEACATLVPTGP